ncbi:MAG: undecaprenyl-diphosphate phosphatase [Limisphaerales bacterium]
MTDWITAVALGVIEGVNEILPITSTGHLLLAEHWFPAQSELFNVVIQSGAVVAVLAVFWKHVKKMAQTLHTPETRDYLLKIFTAFVITGIGGLALKKSGFTLPHKIAPIAYATLIGGLVILAIEFALRGKQLPTRVTWTVVIAVGIGQLLAAACPGTSRSAATILFAMAVGLARPAATEFSFLVGIPTMFAAGGYEIQHELKHAVPGHHENWTMVAIATIVAAITAFLVVKWLLKFVQSHTFNGFAWYRIALGIALFIWFV